MANQFLTAWDNMKKKQAVQANKDAENAYITNISSPKPTNPGMASTNVSASIFDGDTPTGGRNLPGMSDEERKNAALKALEGRIPHADKVTEFLTQNPTHSYDVMGYPTQKQPTVSSAVASAKAKLQELRKKTYTDPYGDDLNRMIEEFNNRKAFDYQLNTDQLFLNAREQYVNQGQKAMRDAMGAAATMTGGYGNSYASQVGNQAYQQYLQELNNSIPEFYGSALDRYNAEGQQMLDKINLKDAQRKDDYAMWEARHLRDLENAALDYDMAVADEQGKALEGTTSWDRLSDAEKEDLRLQYAKLGINPDGSPLTYTDADGKVVASPVGENKLKAPTQKMYEEAKQAYITGGEQGLDTYLYSLDGYNPINLREWVIGQGLVTPGNLNNPELVTPNLDGHTIGDTALYWGDINDNQTITINVGTEKKPVNKTMTMKEAYDMLEKDYGLSREEILDILKQYQYGYSVNWDNFLSLLPVPLAQQHGAGQNIATLVRWLSDKFGGTDYINAKK